MKRSSSLAAVALTATLGAVAAGCATTSTANDRVNPEVPLWFHRPSGALSVFAQRPLTASSRVVGEEYEKGRPAIDVAHERVFVGSSDHGLYALRATDGSSIWRFETLAFVQCEPLYDPALDMVFFGSNDGALYAVHAADGTLAWRFETGAEVSRKPALGGEVLYVANASDQLFALDRRTGRQIWQVHRTPALGMEIAGHAGPALDGGLVYMAYSDGHVDAYDARDGSERWTPVDLSAEAEQAAGGDAPRYLDVDTTPIPDDLPNGRVVYVASYEGGVFALDAQSGARVWVNDKAVGVTDLYLWSEPAHAPSKSGPDADGPTVPARKLLIASSAKSGLWAMEVASGRMVWRIPVPEGGITAPASLMGGLLIGTSRYGLFLLSPRNGRVIDGVDVGTGFSAAPAAYGSRGFVLTNGGKFLGLEVAAPR